MFLGSVYEIRQECGSWGASRLHARLKGGECEVHACLVMAAPVRDPCTERPYGPQEYSTTLPPLLLDEETVIRRGSATAHQISMASEAM
jgi:hypothetical protein